MRNFFLSDESLAHKKVISGLDLDEMLDDNSHLK